MEAMPATARSAAAPKLAADEKHTVELRGFVYSLHQREEAEKIAYKTPGVEKVINDLKVDLEQPYLC